MVPKMPILNNSTESDNNIASKAARQNSSPSRRSLTVLFRRDESKDRREGRIVQHGYQILWPDGDAVVVGLEAFCRYGVRWLGLNRHLAGRAERLMKLTCVDLRGRDDDLTSMPGCRTRRVSLRRSGSVGRIHFIDGTATEVVFVLGKDERRVVEWIGLSDLPDGGVRWMDVAARPLEPSPREPALAQLSL